VVEVVTFPTVTPLGRSKASANCEWLRHSVAIARHFAAPLNQVLCAKRVFEMIAFRIFLVGFLIALSAYSAVAIANQGWNLFPFFFGDMAAMNWAGQFNFDFMGFLFLSATWTMWRNQFSVQGTLLGVLAFFGGMMFLSIYLLYLSFHCDGQMRKILLGNRAEEGAGT